MLFGETSLWLNSDKRAIVDAETLRIETGCARRVEQKGHDVAGNIDPTREQFKAFMKLSGDGPIWMLNLIRLRKKAKYEDGGKASGADAYKTYGKESEPFFKGVGGKIVWSGAPQLVLIGPESERWDLAFVAEYPNAAAFAEMIKNPGYQAVVHHRQAAVKDSRLIRIGPGEAGKLFG